MDKLSEIEKPSKSIIDLDIVNDADIITEGKAKAYFPKSGQVFYNPIQEFNRDLSIAVLNTYSTKNKSNLKLLEALAASGIRSMRYALEIDNLNEIIANDYDKRASNLIDLNIKLNNVENKVKSNCGDAISYMHDCSKKNSTKFDCIDLDPFGTPTPFLDSAMRSIKNGGILLVTATDAGVLCGNGADTCYTKYGSISLRTPCCHELALRILLQSINSHAIRYSKYIVPLISLSIDFYFRVFLLVCESQMKAKETATKNGFAYVCSGCQTYHLQTFGNAEPTNNNFKFIPSNVPVMTSDRCQNCNGKFHLTGPLWLAPLHDKSFVNEVLTHVQQKSHLDYSTKDRIVGMLNLIAEELEEPLYYTLDDICSVMHCVMPRHEQFRSAIINANYNVSYSHCNKNSIKTNAPSLVIWDIMKQWVKSNPIGEKWNNINNRVYHIINRPSSSDIVYDFTVRKDAMPKSKIDKLIRFHQPPPFWGPGKRGTCHEINVKTKKKKISKNVNKNEENTNTTGDLNEEIDDVSRTENQLST